MSELNHNLNSSGFQKRNGPLFVYSFDCHALMLRKDEINSSHME